MNVDSKRVMVQNLQRPSKEKPLKRLDMIIFFIRIQTSETQEKVCQLKVFNDSTEYGIALIHKFNFSITMKEKQKQYLLCLVDLH